MFMLHTRWFGPWALPHLSDESLVELHTLLVSGEQAVAARYLRHLKQCDDCARRFDALREDAAALRHDVATSVEALITPARLDRQFDVIMRRLEGHSGRLLAFPRAARRTAPVQPLRRWLAMAAAAGLLVGIGAGRLMGPVKADPAALWRARTDAVRPVPSTLSQETDEQMLVEIDAAIARSRSKEFRVLDQLTPRASDIRARPTR
ncbi:MAG: hypothetical protein IT182_15625 [Acidobacteria bacterium]|nr:hypothetical protein [Acidobacteriota bacterium]